LPRTLGWPEGLEPLRHHDRSGAKRTRATTVGSSVAGTESLVGVANRPQGSRARRRWVGMSLRPEEQGDGRLGQGAREDGAHDGGDICNRPCRKLHRDQSGGAQGIRARDPDGRRQRGIPVGGGSHRIRRRFRGDGILRNGRSHVQRRPQERRRNRTHVHPGERDRFSWRRLSEQHLVAAAAPRRRRVGSPRGPATRHSDRAAVSRSSFRRDP
jgi:hypothetical protein